MGFLKKLLLGTAGIKTYQNVFNKPTVIPPPGYVIRALKQKGVGSIWVVTYSKKHQMNIKQNFTVRGASTTSVSVGGDKFIIDWP